VTVTPDSKHATPPICASQDTLAPSAEQETEAPKGKGQPLQDPAPRADVLKAWCCLSCRGSPSGVTFPLRRPTVEGAGCGTWFLSDSGLKLTHPAQGSNFTSFQSTRQQPSGLGVPEPQGWKGDPPLGADIVHVLLSPSIHPALVLPVPSKGRNWLWSTHPRSRTFWNSLLTQFGTWELGRPGP
jgi:hypothetical protein